MLSRALQSWGELSLCCCCSWPQPVDRRRNPVWMAAAGRAVAELGAEGGKAERQVGALEMAAPVAARRTRSGVRGVSPAPARATSRRLPRRGLPSAGRGRSAGPALSRWCLLQRRHVLRTRLYGERRKRQRTNGARDQLQLRERRILVPGRLGRNRGIVAGALFDDVARKERPVRAIATFAASAPLRAAAIASAAPISCWVCS